MLWPFGILDSSRCLNCLKIVEFFAEILFVFLIILVHSAVRERVMRQHTFSTDWVSLRLSKATIPVIARRVLNPSLFGPTNLIHATCHVSLRSFLHFSAVGAIMLSPALSAIDVDCVVLFGAF